MAPGSRWQARDVAEDVNVALRHRISFLGGFSRSDWRILGCMDLQFRSEIQQRTFN